MHLKDSLQTDTENSHRSMYSSEELLDWLQLSPVPCSLPKMSPENLKLLTWKKERAYKSVLRLYFTMQMTLRKNSFKQYSD